MAVTLWLVALCDLLPGLSQDKVLYADIVSFILGGEHALFFWCRYGHESILPLSRSSLSSSIGRQCAGNLATNSIPWYAAGGIRHKMSETRLWSVDSAYRWTWTGC